MGSVLLETFLFAQKLLKIRAFTVEKKGGLVVVFLLRLRLEKTYIEFYLPIKSASQKVFFGYPDLMFRKMSKTTKTTKIIRRMACEARLLTAYRYW